MKTSRATALAPDTVAVMAALTLFGWSACAPESAAGALPDAADAAGPDDLLGGAGDVLPDAALPDGVANDGGTTDAGTTTDAEVSNPSDVPSPSDLPNPDDVWHPSDTPPPVDAGPAPESCCNGDGDCAPGHRCIAAVSGGLSAFGVCRAQPTVGRCWDIADCGADQTCHGAVVCECGVTCKTEHQGVCVTPGPGCTAVQESWVEETCDAANVVIFDGSQCKHTCPGCCGCGPFCDLTFDSVAACEQACQVPPMPGNCPRFIGALPDCSYDYQEKDGCPSAVCRDYPCSTDADCTASAAAGGGAICVLGSCVDCWNDAQCPDPTVCRAGRCVHNPSGPEACPEAPPCSTAGCHLVQQSESPCPVCVCDSLFSKPCSTDGACQTISSEPYSRCVYGRCAKCRSDADCDGAPCLPPGLCYAMTPHPEALYGTWLLGWGGGLDHFSYFRFEPDGTLRRGRYVPDGAWSDDIPNPPCWQDVDPWPPAPLLGTWEPEVTQSGFLIVRMSINFACDPGSGWTRRYRFTLSDGGAQATLDDVDSDQDLMGFKVETGLCEPDMGLCALPVWPSP